jgi:cell division protein FtsB
MSVKKALFIVVLIVLGFVINNLAQSIYGTWQKKNLVMKTKEGLEREKKENADLKQKLVDVNRPGFIEEEARNKLLLTKPGEEMVVMQTIAPEKTLRSSRDGVAPNWKKWIELFF